VVGAVSLVILAMAISEYSEQAIPAALLQPLVDLAAAGLVASLTVRGAHVGRLFSLKPLVGLGLISYSVYLWHYPIALIWRTNSGDWRVVLAKTFALSVAIATASFFLVERPLQEWRRRKLAFE
jgi:peptidoglycan/LPS O-acetylase OafA/YrhL